MIVTIKRKNFESCVVLIINILLLCSLFVGITLNTDYVIGADNITNQTDYARVNVTNTEPNITSVTVEDNLSAIANEIDLKPGGVHKVVCNATVFDYNGWQDINPNMTNATFYIASVGRDGPTDNNFRYRNESCGHCISISSTTAACDCKFPVQYYANWSNNWICNVTVRDQGGHAQMHAQINFTDTDASSAVTVTKLLAIDTGNWIDYKNLSVTETSDEIVHNVTNVGNRDFNLSLRSYGGTQDKGPGDPVYNKTMLCDFGNISFGYQRFAFGTENIGTTVFGNMANVTNTTEFPMNYTWPQRENDNIYDDSRNATLWRLQIPYSVGGLCNGTLIFGAAESYAD